MTYVLKKGNAIFCETLKYSNNMVGQPPAKRKATQPSIRQNKRNITIKLNFSQLFLFGGFK
jgi:hypothetical protein